LFFFFFRGHTVALTLRTWSRTATSLASRYYCLRESKSGKDLALCFSLWKSETVDLPRQTQDGSTNMMSHSELSVLMLLSLTHTCLQLLESPHIDGFVSPFEYTDSERAVTAPLGPEKLFSSLAHHGKIAMIEVRHVSSFLCNLLM
jgi:hypothetical protein